MRFSLRLLLILSSLCGLLAPAYGNGSDSSASTARLSPQQLQEDLRFVQAQISRIHPDLNHSVDAGQLPAAFDALAAQLQQPMTRDEAWQRFASLNPLFADGHLALTQPDPTGQMAAHLKDGGGLFPFEVHIDANGALWIKAELGGAPTPLAGARIVQINGQPVATQIAALLALCHGDTPQFRVALLAQRFAFFHLKRFGNVSRSSEFELELEQQGKRQLLRQPASTQLPAVNQASQQFAQQFQFELMPDQAALMTINTFYWPDKPAFLQFTERAFRAIRDAKVKTLIIDVRQNGGGNDDMWMDGILRYIADKPYRWASSYSKKVIAGRESASEPLGAIIQGEITRWLQPQLDYPLHYRGKTYVLTGSGTYSSAVLFSNVMQDFGFATVVAGDAYARARQSGGVQVLSLPHSGLEIGVPRLIFYRPAGDRSAALMQADWPLPDDPLAPRSLVEHVLQKAAEREHNHAALVSY